MKIMVFDWHFSPAALLPRQTNNNVWVRNGGKLCRHRPENDFFTDAFLVSGASGSTSDNNKRATGESGEPQHAGNTNTASIWYNWTRPGWAWECGVR